VKSREEPIRILVVDDDEAYRRRLVRALRDRGHAVEGAAGVAEAERVARTFRPQRAVLDLRLGDGSGVELVSRLLALDPALQCLVLTGYGSIATAVEAVRRGAIDYLTKPLDADEILLAFEARTAGGREAGRSEAGAASAAGAAAPPAGASVTVPSLHRVEWEHIQRVLGDCGGNISEAARQLGMHRRTLQRKLATLPPEK
jgi:two-component system, response regulator RegA